MLQQYIEHLQTQGNYWFTRESAQCFFDFSDDAFRQAAYRMMKKGKINRIRGQFYTIVPLEYRASGSLPVSWFIDAFLVYLKQQYYVGILTAASLQGAAHQQPMEFQVVTDKPTRPVNVGRSRIKFYYKKNIPQYFLEPVKSPTGVMNVSKPEVTACDLIQYMNAAGQLSNVATVLSELVEKINVDELVKLIDKGDVGLPVAQRLGYLIDTFELPINLEPMVKCLKKRKYKKQILVANGEKKIISHNKKWHILVNEAVELDEL